MKITTLNDVTFFDVTKNGENSVEIEEPSSNFKTVKLTSTVSNSKNLVEPLEISGEISMVLFQKVNTTVYSLEMLPIITRQKVELISSLLMRDISHLRYLVTTVTN
jgi:hypothetical protein